MARILYKIGNPQEEFNKLNDNFDRISLDMADRSGIFSSVGSVSGLSIPAGETRSIQVNVIEDGDKYEEGRLPVIPRVEVYVDNDVDGNYLYPAGGLLTQANIHGISLEVFVNRTIFNQVEGEKATYFVIIKNNDAGAHTFYVYVDGYYVPAPDIGVAQRADT